MMQQPGKGFLVWLAGLSVLGFLATDMYLPAFAAMQQDLNTSAASVSASLSLFLAGFWLGQLFWGPLSDRYGRKPVLLSGLAIFAIGCLGMLWVRDANLMLALRLIQAPGGLGAPGGGGGGGGGGFDLAGDGHRLLSSAKNQPDFRRHYAAGRFIAGAGAAARQLAAGPF